MITAKCPHISNEQTTVKFMIEGLREHHQFKDVIRALKISCIPDTIDGSYERLQDIEEQNSKADPAQTSAPQGASSGERHLPPHQREHQTRRAPYNPEERWRRGRGRGRWGQTRNFNTKQIAQIAQVMVSLNNVRREHGGERRAPRRGTGTRRDTKRASQAQNTENSPEVTDKDEREEATINAITERFRYHSEVAHDSDLKYILDPAAHPTHINHRVPKMRKLKTPLTTHTATSTSNGATHQGTLRLKTDRGVQLNLPAIIHPEIRTNLVSVHKLAKQHGHVLF